MSIGERKCCLAGTYKPPEMAITRLVGVFLAGVATHVFAAECGSEAHLKMEDVVVVENITYGNAWERRYKAMQTLMLDTYEVKQETGAMVCPRLLLRSFL